MIRLTFRFLLLVLAATALAGCGKKKETGAPGAEAGVGAPRALQKIDFLTDWFPQAEHGGFYQAVARGYYREAGLDVTIVPGGPGPTIEQKLVAGIGQLAMARSDDMMVNTSRGLPFVIVAAFMQRDPQALLLHEENAVASFADLDGKTIMAQPSVVWPQYLMSRYKIRINLIPLNFGLAQFMADRNFIQQCFVTNEPYYVRKNGLRPKTLLIADSGYNPYRVIATTRSFTRDNPEAVRAFVTASLRGWEDFMNGNPAPGKALIAAANKQMDDDFMNYSIRSMHEHRLISGDLAKGEYIGQLSRARLQQQLDMLADLKLLPSPLTVERAATFEFLPGR
jgi:NitT/TauT family transport system substrate-binding protein